MDGEFVGEGGVAGVRGRVQGACAGEWWWWWLVTTCTSDTSQTVKQNYDEDIVNEEHPDNSSHSSRSNPSVKNALIVIHIYLRPVSQTRPELAGCLIASSPVSS